MKISHNFRRKLCTYIASLFPRRPIHSQTSPLKQAKVSLKLFIASGDDLSYLKEASDSARLAVIQGHTLDAKLNAATIAVAAGYIYQSTVSQPFDRLLDVCSVQLM